VSHSIVNNTAHANFEAANCKPGATDTGPFYFGIGVPGDGAGYITQYIKEVTLVGAQGTADVIGTPLYFTYDNGTGDVNYPVFTGWPTFAGGDNGIQWSDRVMADGTTVAATKTQAAITFNLNYTGAPAATVKKVMKGNALKVTADGEGLGDFPLNPTQPGGLKAFVGWNTAANGSGDTKIATDTFSADIVLYAQWSDPIIITITPNGGNWAGDTADKSVTIGRGGSLDAASLVAPVKTGYRFDKWTKGNGDTVTAGVTTFADTDTVTAQWVETVDVTFNLNFIGGTNILKTPDKGTAIADFPANPSRGDYYAFIGWNLRADGKGIPVVGASKFSVNTTVYAIWKVKPAAPADLVYLSTTISGAQITTSKKYALNLAANPPEGNYFTNAALQWTIASMNIPAGYDLTSYESYTVKVKAYLNADYTNELVLSDLPQNTNVFQLKFSTHASSMSDDYSGNDRVLYNVGSMSDGTPSVVYGIRQKFLPKILNEFAATPILSMFLQGGGNLAARDVKSVEITDIIFHTGLSGAVAIDFGGLDDPMFGPSTLSDQTWNVSKGDLRITVPGYDAYRWLVNGVQQGTTISTLTLQVKDYVDVINTNIAVTVLGAKDGFTYSKTIVVAVKR